MLTDWNYKNVQDFDCLDSLWNEWQEKLLDVDFSNTLYKALTNRLGMPIVNMSAEKSRFFKHHYDAHYKQYDLSTSEMEIIRKVEHW